MLLRVAKPATATYIKVVVFFWVFALCSGYISDVSYERTGSLFGVTELFWLDVKVMQIYRQELFLILFQHPLKTVRSL